MKNLILTLLFLIAGDLLGMDPIILTEDKGEYPLGLYLEILEDIEGKLTIGDVQRPETGKQWGKSKSQVPSYGFTKNVYWARFQIQSNFNKDFYLEVAHPLLDKIQFYQIQNNKEITRKETGDILPFHTRDVDYKNFVFHLPVTDSNDTIYYLRIESESSVQIPLTLWSPLKFTENKTKEMYIIGLFFGVMIVMALYNFFVWFSIRDKSYIYYVFYISFSAFFYANYIGITYQFLWLWSPKVYNNLLPISLASTVFFMIQFTVSYLHTKETQPILYRILSFLAILLLVDLALPFLLSHRLAMATTILLGVPASPLMLVSGIITLRKGYKPALYYLIAWTMFLLGIISISLVTFGILPKNFITQNSMQIGSALEVILLSLGLANRINELKKEKEDAQLEAMANQQLAIKNLEKANRIEKDYAENLERKVTERTFQLNEKMMEVQFLKNQQDGDYFLTTLLIEPLIANKSRSKSFRISFFIEQKKKFTFRDKKYQLGGDICISGDLKFESEKYILFFNGDAMGKSMQGAGGALVIGSVLNSILARSAARGKIITGISPEQWLQETYEEIHSVMEAFEGCMLVSCILGLIHESTGEMLYFNAEHPFSILLRDEKAAFIENKINTVKIGLPVFEQLNLYRFQLYKNDIVFLGSDGKDDILIDGEMNEDENLILEVIENSGSDMQRIYDLLSEKGEIRDDLSLVKIEFFS